MVEPENRIKACKFRIFHVTIATYTAVNAVVNVFYIVSRIQLSTRPSAGKRRVIGNRSEKLINERKNSTFTSKCLSNAEGRSHVGAFACNAAVAAL